VRNGDGHTAVSVAAGCSHENCVRALQSYGEHVDKRSAMQVSLRRRDALRAMKSVESQNAALERVAAVWERVLDTAARRLEALERLPAASTSSSLVSRKRHSHGTSTRWERLLDPESSFPYFLSEDGLESAWAAEAGLPSNLDGCFCWNHCVDHASGATYMLNARTGEAVWVVPNIRTPNSLLDPDSDVSQTWTLCVDPSSVFPYFLCSGDSSDSEWCTDPEWQSRLQRQHLDVGTWRRFVDTHAKCSYFVHMGSGHVLWGSPVSHE
jgi:hypothetical protein